MAVGSLGDERGLVDQAHVVQHRTLGETVVPEVYWTWIMAVGATCAAR
jgi:hypothetical protein